MHSAFPPPAYEHPPEQYPPPPTPHPKQLIAPTPALVITRVTILNTPSPNTNPLATTIAISGVSPLVLALALRHAIYPPISLAKLKLGEFKKPIAKAMPEGRYLISLGRGCEGGRLVGKALAREKREKMRPKTSMKGTTWSGRWPLFSRRARFSLLQSANGPWGALQSGWECEQAEFTSEELQPTGNMTHQIPADGTAN
jgi:hypothetical protein